MGEWTYSCWPCGTWRTRTRLGRRFWCWAHRAAVHGGIKNSNRPGESWGWERKRSIRTDALDDLARTTQSSVSAGCAHLNVDPVPAPDWTCRDCVARLSNDAVIAGIEARGSASPAGES